ncbi:MAG: 2-C-methyl-D-erythritol 4-phosphate cytidylyltransferase [Clostridiales bacterium]|jgi:2-C-methyl-D-erythritol 4-phosphate cytidylyltransferase|nr:2-C-methyl-D-erythritol 4-phosphate cytidylyltransferase [Clostridiales bacterium]
MDKSKVTAIVLAAGKGKRMNSSLAKQFLMLHQRPILYYSLKAFEESSVDEIVLVTGEDQVVYCRENIVKQYKIGKVSQIIVGGSERYDSVYKALLAVEKSDYVLIHDGARPFISKDLIENVILQVKTHRACILGTPVKETIKVINTDGYIAASPDRSTLWNAQTPQAFEYETIKKAYTIFNQDKDRDRNKMTDDAMIYETYLNQPVKMLLGDYRNIKITTPEDLAIAEALIDDLLC